MDLRKTSFACLVLAALLALTPAAWGQGACIDFEPPTFVLGDLYGAPAGHVPGDWVFSSMGVDGYVVPFLYLGGGGTFNRAFIDNAPPTLGPSQSLRFNNIDIVFDYSRWPALPTRVMFDYVDLGGEENLSINGSPVFIGNIWAAPAVLGGVNVSVSQVPIPGGFTGTVKLDGVVKYFRVGGQEFWIDDLCAAP